MKIQPLLVCFLILLTVDSCKATRDLREKKVNLNDAFLREDGLVHASVKGYWKSIGNGYILDATTDSVLLYSYTESYCYKEKNDYIEALLNDKARFYLRNDTISIFKADFGDKSTSLQIQHDYIRIDRLPENHMTFNEMKELNPKELFYLFLETYQENYAFSKERNMKWDAIKTEFESMISDSTTEDELFQIFGQIVSRTEDHHTKIIAENGQTLQYRGTPSAQIVSEVYQNQKTVTKLDDYYNLFFTNNYKNISDSLLHGEGHKVANDQIEWGGLNKNVGYICFHSFTNFAPNSYSRAQQLDSLNYHMENIMNSLKSKEALILDISFNFGGFDAAFLTVASYFTDKTKLAYTSQVYNNGTYYNESEVYIHPADKIIFNKPVYLLMTDISRSAAEDFAMTMKANDNVKLIGTNTLGILSSMLGKSIGSFYATCSNQRLVLPDGNYFEVTGVKPDIEMTVFTKENIFGGHKESVRKIVDMIERKYSRP